MLRRHVRVTYNGIQGAEIQRIESVFPASHGRLSGIPSVPMSVCQQITDFGHLFPFVFLQGDAALPDHFTGVLQHHGPKPESMLPVTTELLLHPQSRFGITKSPLISVHHPFILQDSRQRRQVGKSHFTQLKSLSFQNNP